MTFSWDSFFNYSENPVTEQSEFDLWAGLLQAGRSLYYFRREGANISLLENNATSLSLLIDIRYNVVKWVAYRNDYVSRQNGDYPDRRLAVSQNSIIINQDVNKGEVDIQVYYITYSELKKPRSIKYITGGV